MQISACDADTLDWFENVAGAKHAPKHLPVGQYNGTPVQDIGFDTVTDHRYQPGIALIVCC